MAHQFTDEDGNPIVLSPIEVRCDVISQDFYDTLEEFGDKVKKIHPCDRMLAELEALHG
ncbi:MAG: hypothetical protein NXH70_02120 [Hyphomonas sp.]|nr:hypothetical protein [Hyphomonas sp.]